MTDRGRAGSAEGIERGRMTADELSWALRAVNRSAAELDQALAARVGLRPLDFAAMGHIMDSEGAALGPAELGHRLGISTGSATELADRLERAGHIFRARDSDDRRRVSLRPHPEAVGRILGELAPLFEALDRLATGYTSAEQDAIGRYLRQASSELDAHAAALETDAPTAR